MRILSKQNHFMDSLSGKKSYAKGDSENSVGVITPHPSKSRRLEKVYNKSMIVLKSYST